MSCASSPVHVGIVHNGTMWLEKSGLLVVWMCQNLRRNPVLWIDFLILGLPYTISNAHSGKKTPKEIRAAGASAFRDSEKLQLLQEQWTACQGQWRQSDFWIQLKRKKRNRKFGSRRWLMRSEIASLFGSDSVAQEIIDAKMCDAEVRASQVRANPNLHGRDSEEWVLYFVVFFSMWNLHPVLLLQKSI